ncbi:response regulator transcription factor [Bacillus ndiopicus]|uniref:response regulator transcription factor n=1 Tax=Bacillus ndiopicus TaxID=1347368 RepID=UPI0005A847C5|nr:response regulator transcription factor [Bacillus ndiopicus]
MTKIAIVEDDIMLKKYIKEYLEADHYTVYLIDELGDVLTQIEELQPDLILLDINLPQYDGFFYTKILRKRMATPLIILSARSDESEQIRGITQGADDYITKPFSMGILLAKIEAVLRRATPQTAQFTIDNLILNCDKMVLSYNAKEVELSKNEFKLMKVFMQKPNTVITREDLLSELWDDGHFVDDNTLSVNMTRLKQRLKDLHIIDAFVTKRGIGYVFTPPMAG